MFNLKDLVSNLIFSEDKKNLEEFLKDLQRTLIKADVDVKVVLDITKKLKEEFKEKKKLDPNVKRLIISILYEELLKYIGEGKELIPQKKPFKIMLIGLYGSGKTTTAAKLAHYYQKKGFKTVIIQTDKYRPASYEQLKQLFDKVIDLRDKIEKIDEKEFEELVRGYDLIIIDTGGRHSLDDKLIEEIKQLKEKLKPNFSIYVVPAEVGKVIKKEAEVFKQIGIDGLIVTRFDGSAKGGGILVASKLLEVPILFLGTGEKIEDLELFDPKRFLSRILGMGDLESLLEKAKEIQLEKLAEQENWQEKLMKGTMTFDDLLKQFKMIKRMGSLQKIISFIPGLGAIPKEIIEEQEKKIKKWEVIIQSMNKKERKNYKYITPQRIKLIAYGSGTSEKEVKELIEYLKQMNELGKALSSGNFRKLEKMMRQLEKQGINFPGMPRMPKGFGRFR